MKRPTTGRPLVPLQQDLVQEQGVVFPRELFVEDCFSIDTNAGSFKEIYHFPVNRERRLRVCRRNYTEPYIISGFQLFFVTRLRLYFHNTMKFMCGDHLVRELFDSPRMTLSCISDVLGIYFLLSPVYMVPFEG